MRLPVPPIEPMLAKIADELPQGEGFLFEPKWDGFRAIVFRSGDAVHIQSRDLRQLNRYFPELEAALVKALPKGCVIDGETASLPTPRPRPTSPASEPCSRSSTRARPTAWSRACAGTGIRRTRWVRCCSGCTTTPLRPERVCEVKYDHLQGDRFRHAAVFLRWRPDKPPADCRHDQLEAATPFELEKVFGACAGKSRR